MSREQILDEFKDAGALLEGHFVLSSGLHSSAYIQCARVLMDAKRAARLCGEVKEKVHAAGFKEFDMVASPAMGGVVVGYEMGRQLDCPSIFFERVDGTLTLRRGFSIAKGARCLMMEDIVTTGLSSRECIDAITNAGGQVVAASCLIDRSAGKSELGVPLVALLEMEVPAYAEADMPPELRAIPVEKPGSRELHS
ncbi:MAG: orotate phosphoribosyltransferase [Hyphomicrobiales bacterium]